MAILDDHKSLSGAHTRTDSASLETELKLLISPANFDKFCRAALERLPVKNKGTVRNLETVYYDTNNQELFASNSSLRVRRAGKRFIQTLKNSSTDAALTRNEWEVEITDEMPNLSAFTAKELATFLNGTKQADLAPIFTTIVRRHAVLVEDVDARVEIAFDRGTINAGSHQLQLSEVELELKEGEPAALYRLGLKLADIAPLQLGTQSKSARGYALVSKKQSNSTKASESTFLPGDTVDEAIAKLFCECQRQLTANIHLAENSDPDGIHQMRVALRRLRTLLWILRQELAGHSLAIFDQGARTLAKTLGEARNWDVFAASTIPALERLEIPNINLAYLSDASAAFNTQAHDAVFATLKEPQTTQFLLSLGLFIEEKRWRNEAESKDLAVLGEPVRIFSNRVLASAQNKVLKRGQHFERLTTKERHRLRLSLKKLRYTAEFFLPLYGSPKTDKFIKRLKKLQDALGQSNDAETAQLLMMQITEHSSEPEVHRAIGALIGWHHSQQLAALSELRGLWTKSKHQQVFWKGR
ncbi:CYTH and CHAD domain-containing protein [Phyllobacterium sp. K27]